MLTFCTSVCNSSRMQNKRFTVNQIIHTATCLLVTIRLSSYMTDRRTITIGNRSIAKKICCVYSIFNRAAIIHGHTSSLVSIKFHIGRITLGLNQIQLFQIRLCCRVHRHTSKLCLCISKHLTRVNKCGCADLLCCICLSCGQIENMIRHSGLCFRCSAWICRGGSKHPRKNRNQFFLHIARPVLCHQITDRFHRVRSGKCCGQVSCCPHLLTKDCGGYIFVRTDLCRCHFYILKCWLGFSL